MKFIVYNIILMVVYYFLEFVGQKTSFIKGEDIFQNITQYIIITILSMGLTYFIMKKVSEFVEF